MNFKDIAVLPPIRRSIVGSVPLQVEKNFKSPLERPGPGKTPKTDFLPFGEDGFTFLDILDIVNPLHHFPVIGSLYRKITGDTLDPLPRVVGNTLYLGPMGGAISGADLVLEHTSGHNFDEHLFGLFDGRNNRAKEDTVSQNTNDPSEHEKIADKSNQPPNDNNVSSWAQAEILYRQRLLNTSKTVATVTTHSFKQKRYTSQKINGGTPHTKENSMISKYMNKQIVAANKPHVASEKNDFWGNSERRSASTAAAAYNTAMNRANLVLP